MKRTNIETRIKAYNLMIKLIENKFPWTVIIKQISNNYKISYGTVFGWYKYGLSPFGKRKIQYCKELFYVLGALLGDGCAYYWKKNNKYMVIIVGEKEFMNKYSNKLSICTGKRVKEYIDRSKNTWNHKTWNIELYLLFKSVQRDLNHLHSLLRNTSYYENSLSLIEGFFDAEGCVKIIKEKVRKTPKICLDITNVNYDLVDLIRKLLQNTLGIEARYSIQKPFIGKDGFQRQKIYHLRIYKKEHIRKFFESMSTIKLKPEKSAYVKNWLNNGK